jgi:hypothetical protein
VQDFIRLRSLVVIISSSRPHFLSPSKNATNCPTGTLPFPTPFPASFPLPADCFRNTNGSTKFPVPNRSIDRDRPCDSGVGLLRPGGVVVGDACRIEDSPYADCARIRGSFGAVVAEEDTSVFPPTFFPNSFVAADFPIVSPPKSSPSSELENMAVPSSGPDSESDSTEPPSATVYLFRGVGLTLARPLGDALGRGSSFTFAEDMEEADEKDAFE